IRIYLVFYKKLLEPAPLDAELVTDIELKDDEYEVEEIKDLQKIGRNLTNCKLLVREYYWKHLEKRGEAPRRGRNN
ncbi:hypothetical protein COCHEDRAFT_1098792, partial [Bipolaris maydis C5]